MANIKDIARLAKVSKSTVSRVVSNKGFVKPETRAAIEKVMEDLSQTTPQLPKIVKNVGDTTDTVPILVLQIQQVMIELERLIKQLQTSWLLGGRSREGSQTAERLSPLEVRP